MELVLGFTYIVIGAACGGSFGLPSKYVRADAPWGVLWGPFFFIVTVLMPLLITPLVVRDSGTVYGQAGTATLVAVLAFGFLWGLGSMTLGMSFAFIGLSLAYALNYLPFRAGMDPHRRFGRLGRLPDFHVAGDPRG